LCGVVGDYSLIVSEVGDFGPRVHGKGEGWLPGGFTKRWDEFIKNNPNANRQDIFDFEKKLLKEYKLENYNIHKYRK